MSIISIKSMHRIFNTIISKYICTSTYACIFQRYFQLQKEKSLSCICNKNRFYSAKTNIYIYIA